MTTADLPALSPTINPETKPFWDALAEGRFVLPRCDSCGLFIWYPRVHCPRCHSTASHWEPASGKGSIYSFTVVRRGAPEAFAGSTPYVLAYVELDEGPRVYTNIVKCAIEDLRIGQRVRIDLSPMPGGIVLPRFEPLFGDALR